MPQDARVTSAIAHWAPRFLANGVTLTDFEEVTTSVSAWDDWCAAWSRRAGVYYHFGKFLFVHDVPQMKAAHMKAVACRGLALPYLVPAGERVEMPYQGRWLAGILRKPL